MMIMTQEIRRNFTSLGFALGCLVLYFVFPIGDFKLEILLAALSFLLFLPILYNKIVLGQNMKVLGFQSFHIDVISIFYLISSIVLGGLFSFFVFSLQWGVQNYIGMMSLTILKSFVAFSIYELFFVSIAIFLITFFSWGFVYSIKWHNPIYSFLIAFGVFSIMMWNFYNSFWIIIPFMIPVFFVQKIRDEKNITYLFIAIYCISLIFDVLVIKSFN